MSSVTPVGAAALRPHEEKDLGRLLFFQNPFCDGRRGWIVCVHGRVRVSGGLVNMCVCACVNKRHGWKGTRHSVRREQNNQQMRLT